MPPGAIEDRQVLKHGQERHFEPNGNARSEFVIRNAAAKYARQFRSLSLLSLVSCTALLFSIQRYTISIEIKNPAVAVLAAMALLAMIIELMAQPGFAQRLWNQVKTAPLLWPWLGLMIYGTFQSGHPQNFDQQAAIRLWWLGWAVGLLFVIEGKSSRCLIRWLWLHAALGIIIGVYALLQALEADSRLLQFIGLQPIEWPSFDWGGEIRRVVGTLGNPDFLADYLVGTLPLLFPLWRNTAKSGRRNLPAKIIISFSAGLQILAIVLTISRGVWLGVISGAAMACFLWISSRKQGHTNLWNMRKTAFVGIVALFVLCVAALTFRPVLQSLGARFGGAGQASVSSRVLIYQGTLSLIGEHPWAGSGLGTFGERFPEVRPLALSKTEPFINRYIADPHSDILHVAVELGLIGLVLWIWLLGTAWKTGMLVFRRDNRKAAWIAAACLVGLAALFGHNLVTVTMRRIPSLVLFWQMIGIMATLEWSTREAKDKVECNKPSPLVSIGFIAILIAAICLLWFPATSHIAAEGLIQKARTLTESIPQAKSEIQKIQWGRAAMQFLERADRLEPDRKDLWHWRGTAASQLRDYSTALICFERLLEIAGNFIGTRHNIATTHLQIAEEIRKTKQPGLQSIALEEIQTAISWSQKAVEDDPNEPKYLDHYGYALFLSGRIDEAIQYMRKAYELYRDPLDKRIAEDMLRKFEETQRVLENTP